MEWLGKRREKRGYPIPVAARRHLLLFALVAFTHFLVIIGCCSVAGGDNADAAQVLLTGCSHAHTRAAQRAIDDDIAKGGRLVAFLRTAEVGEDDAGGEARGPQEEEEENSATAASTSVLDEARSAAATFTADDEPTWPCYLKQLRGTPMGSRGYALSAAASAMPSPRPGEHTLGRDTRRTVSTTAAAAVDDDVPAAATAQGLLLIPKSGFRPLRVKFDVTHLYEGNSFCSSVGQTRSDFLMHENVSCTALDIFTEAKREYLIDRILPEVQARLGRLFSVKPPAYDDTSPRARAKSAAGGRAATALEDHSTRLLVPQDICGKLLPIPAAHTNDGVVGADIVIYALAAPVSAAPPAPTAGEERGESEGGRQRGAGGASLGPSSQPVRGGGGNTIAWSGYCGVDEVGRPAVARLNFVPRFITPNGPRSMTARATLSTTAAGAGEYATLESQRATVLEGDAPSWWAETYTRAILHEAFHALGFAPPFFTALEEKENRHRRQRGKTDDARGAQSGSAVTGAEGLLQCTAPLVVRAARAFFNCSNMTGVPLENDGGAGTAGAHWERRVLREELMSGTLSTVAAVSSVTAAFFHSLPFYSVDERFTETALMRWGKDAGCDLFQQPCAPLAASRAWGLEGPSRSAEGPAGAAASPSPRLTDSEVTRSRSWCLDFRGLFGQGESERGDANAVGQCTSDRRGIGQCNASPSPSSSSGVGRGTLHGLSAFMDGCPVVETAATLFSTQSLTETVYTGGSAAQLRSVGQDGDVMCTSLGSLDGEGSTSLGMAGHYHGAQSRCVHFATAAYTALPPASLSVRAAEAKCVRLRCPYGKRVEAQVRGSWVACPADGRPGLVPISRNDDSPSGPLDSEDRANDTAWEAAQSWLVCEDAAVVCEPELFYMPPAPPLDVVNVPSERIQKSRRSAKATTSGKELAVDGAVPYPEREVVVTLDLSIRPRSRGGKRSATKKKKAGSHEDEAMLSKAVLDWPGVLVDCAGTTLAALQMDIFAILASNDASSSPRGRMHNDLRFILPTTGLVAFANFSASPSLPEEKAAEAAADAASPYAVPDGAGSSAGQDTAHGTRRHRLNEQELRDASQQPQDEAPQQQEGGASLAAKKDRRAYVVSFTLALTTTSPATTQEVLQRWRSVMEDGVRRQKPLPALTALVTSTPQVQSLCRRAGALWAAGAAAATQKGAGCTPSWLLLGGPGEGDAGVGGLLQGETASALSEQRGDKRERESAIKRSAVASLRSLWARIGHRANPEAITAADALTFEAAVSRCESMVSNWGFVLHDFRVSAVHSPPLVLDSPPVPSVTAAADLALTIEVGANRATTSCRPRETPSGSPASAVAAEDEKSPTTTPRPRRRGAAWLLTPDGAATVANGVRDDLAAALQVTANLVSVNALSSSDVARSGAGLLLSVRATIYAPDVLDADTRRHTRAAWRDRLARLSTTPNASWSMDAVAAATYRVLYGVGIGAPGLSHADGGGASFTVVEEPVSCGGGGDGWSAVLVGAFVAKPQPEGLPSSSPRKAPPPTASLADTDATSPSGSASAATQDGKGRHAEGPSEDADAYYESDGVGMSSQRSHYCFRVPYLTRGDGICVELSFVFFGLTLATVSLLVIMSTVGYVQSSGSLYEDIGDDHDDRHRGGGGASLQDHVDPVSSYVPPTKFNGV